MTGNNTEKRNFSRISFDCGNTTITVGDSTWTTQLIDICLNGALLAQPKGWSPDIGSECQIEIKLNDDGAVISMAQAIVVHCQNDKVGVRCAIIDVDSITHLRRLVELNLGDPEMVNRELTELTKSRL